MYSSIKLLLLLFISLSFQAQTSEVTIRLEVGELNMTFPRIYFKHNSTEYANMPYSVDLRHGSRLEKSGREHCRIDRRKMQKNMYN